MNVRLYADGSWDFEDQPIDPTCDDWRLIEMPEGIDIEMIDVEIAAIHEAEEAAFCRVMGALI